VGPDGDEPGVSPALLEVLVEARALDLLGPMDLGEQIRHALGFAHAFEQARAGHRPLDAAPGSVPIPIPGRWLDLGTGGGLPGLILAQYWADSPAVLLDSAERRTTFLAEAVQTLGWDNRVRVVRARAEEAGRDPGLRTGFDVVWARSFGSPPVTAECAAPFLTPGGLLVVSEPPLPDESPGSLPEDRTAMRWPRAGLAELGQEPLVTVRGRFGYQVIVQAGSCPERFPRRSGVATKRPLYRVSEA
jgi:16S rRNA (guanine527-N7)-methyltransferase